MASERKIAYVDLTSGDISAAPVANELRQQYIGGRGVGDYLLQNHVKQRTEALSPGNTVVVSAGLLGGTLASASGRAYVTSKSPLTGHLGSANIGGFFAPELRHAGFDHIVITGKAPKPAVLFVHDEQIEILDGSSVWGKPVPDTQEALRRQLGDERLQTLCIGPAGEKLVRFASVVTRHEVALGRTGIGAVWGSKGLKAIAVRGTEGIEISFPDAALEYDRQIVREVCSSRFAQMMQRENATSLDGLADNGVVGSHIRLRQPARVRSQAVANSGNYSSGMDTCFCCQLRCRQRYIISEGPYAGASAQGPGYASMVAWGTEVGCRSLNTILVGNYLANYYGLDSLETASLISWAMRLRQQGVLNDNDAAGLDLELGNDQAVIDMINRIGRREGLGDILAEGGLRAARKIGEGSENYLIRAKDLFNLQTEENPDPARIPGESPSDHWEYGGKAGQLFQDELRFTAADMIGLCRSHTVLPSPEMPGFDEFSRMIYLNTGLEIPAGRIRECAENVLNMERLFNVREGTAPPRQHDWLADLCCEQVFVDDCHVMQDF